MKIVVFDHDTRKVSKLDLKWYKVIWVIPLLTLFRNFRWEKEIMQSESEEDK